MFGVVFEVVKTGPKELGHTVKEVRHRGDDGGVKTREEIRKLIERLESKGFRESGKTNACFDCELTGMTVYFKRNPIGRQGEVVESIILCHSCGRMRPWNAWRPRRERVNHAREKGWLKDDIPHRPGW